MKVAVLGPEGTYTHQAADRFFDDLQPVFYSTIREVFEASEEAKFVPVENSLGGRVTDTVDQLYKDGFTVTGAGRMPINHCLISDEDLGDVDTVVSHPQALAQCSEFIDQHGFETREADSTASAVKGIGSGEAAIASEKASELFGKPVLERGVQDRDNNTTRFFALNTGEQGLEKSALILEPGEDRPGLLHAMLSCFAGHQINLSNIQSRPTGEELGTYYFYVEAEASGERLGKAVKCLETYGEVDMLGSFDEVNLQ